MPIKKNEIQSTKDLDVIKIRQLLNDTKEGQLITYDEISKAIGEDVNGGSSKMQAALLSCQKLDGIAFRNVKGEGYRRLTNEEANLYLNEQFCKKTISASRRTRNKLKDTITYHQLSEKGQQTYNLTVLQSSIVEVQFTPEKIHKIQNGNTLSQEHIQKMIKAAEKIF